MRNKLYLETINSHLEQMQKEGLISREIHFERDTVLYGRNGALSSLNMVTLLVDLEEYFSRKSGHPVTLAHEKAFSAGSSPFRTMGSLAEYVQKTVEDYGT